MCAPRYKNINENAREHTRRKHKQHNINPIIPNHISCNCDVYEHYNMYEQNRTETRETVCASVKVFVQLVFVTPITLMFQFQTKNRHMWMRLADGNGMRWHDTQRQQAATCTSSPAGAKRRLVSSATNQNAAQPSLTFLGTKHQTPHTFTRTHTVTDQHFERYSMKEWATHVEIDTVLSRLGTTKDPVFSHSHKKSDTKSSGNVCYTTAPRYRQYDVMNAIARL